MKFVVADIHGEINKLKALVDYILLCDYNPCFIFIGDYIDKGESSYEVLKYLVQLSQRYDCVFLFGNHEYIWLNLYNDMENYSSYLHKYGGEKTIDSFDCRTVEETFNRMTSEFSEFFKKLVKFWKNQEYIVVHSGISSDDFNKQIEDIPLERLLFNRYDFIKSEKLFQKSHKIIFGHTGFYHPYVDSSKIGIDTAACYLPRQPLTAFCLDNNNFYNSKGESYNISQYSTLSCPLIVRVKPFRMNK